MTGIERHDLIYLKESGYEFAMANAHCPLCDISNIMPEVLRGSSGKAPIPGIVRTQWRNISGILDVGYVSDQYTQETRIRIASSVRNEDIRMVVHPQEVFLMRDAWPPEKRMLLGELENAAEKYRCRLGLFGSIALQTVTGRTYLRQASDVDLVLYQEKRTDLAGFYQEILRLQEIYHTRCDVEVVLENIGNAKLFELLSDSTTVLCKSLYGPSVYKKATNKKIF